MIEQIVALWPYVVAALAGIAVALPLYEQARVKNWKTGLRALVEGVHASKKKLKEQGIDYKSNLTALIDARITDPKTRKIVESVIDFVEKASVASTLKAESPDAEARPNP